MQKTISERKYETNLIIELLQQAQIGEKITYQMLSDLTGQSIQKQRWILDSALRYMRREHGYVFDTIQGEGVVRLAEGDKSKKQEKHLDRGRKQFRQIIRIGETVKLAELNKEQAVYHNSMMSHTANLLNHGKPKREQAQKPKVVDGPSSSTVKEILAKHRKQAS